MSAFTQEVEARSSWAIKRVQDHLGNMRPSLIKTKANETRNKKVGASHMRLGASGLKASFCFSLQSRSLIHVCSWARPKYPLTSNLL